MTRNASGESSIFQDSNGRWHGYVSLGVKTNGRRDRRHVSGLRRADVVQKVRALEQKRDAGVAAAAGRAPTVASWLDHWLTTIAARRCRYKTLQGYETSVRLHTVPYIGHHRLDRLEPEHLEALYVSLEAKGLTAAVVERARQTLEAARAGADDAAVAKAKAALAAAEARHRAAPEGLAPASVLRVHRMLHRALKVAMQRQKVQRNVAALVDAPSVPTAEIVPLTDAEAKRLLTTAAGMRNGARWAVALALGVRQGEVLGLQWSRVDLSDADDDAAADGLDGSIDIAVQLQRQKGKGLVVVEVKSEAGKRVIPMPSPVRDLLRAHRAAQHAERLAAGPMWEDGGFVFCQPNGRPIDPRRDNRAWKDLLSAAGVREARLHDARHTAATMLVAMGVHPRVAMLILGHSSISQTLRYMHSVPALAKDALDRVGAALWSEDGSVTPMPRRSGAEA